MSLALALPAGLAALAALLVPLLLHLARREERRITDFAALRWLSAHPRPRRKRRFDERLLLLVRLLLLAALALLLAQPVLTGGAARTPWIVAAPGVPAAAVRAAAGTDRARLHWLAPGFPALDDAPAPQAPQPLASLLRELDATLPAGTPLTVLVPDVIDGADAQRARLSRSVDWRIVPGTETSPARGPSAREPAADAPPLRLEVRAAADAEGLRYLRAAGAAWRMAEPASAVRVAAPGDALPPGTRNTAWLAPGPVPDAILAWVRDGGRLLLRAGASPDTPAQVNALWIDARGDVLVRGTTLGRGRLMQFTRPLTPAAMPELLDAGFPSQLRMLFSDAPAAPARVAARDYAPTPGAAPWPQPQRPLAAWLALLAGLLFLLERWLASGPRREAAA